MSFASRTLVRLDEESVKKSRKTIHIGRTYKEKGKNFTRRRELIKKEANPFRKT
jgi:hypothetical protein